MSQLSPQPSSSPSTSQPTSPNSTTKLLPIPTPSTNNSVHFAYPNSDEAGSSISANLPSEIANADISLAPDGSFVETSSGAAAWELKKRFDAHHGKTTTMPPPYVITAYNNQYGKKMYRIGHKDMPPPGASAVNAEDQITYRASSSSAFSASPPHSSTSSNISPHRRQTRLSFNLLRHGSGQSSYYVPPSGRAKHKGKLRKPRSNPDLQSLDGAAMSTTSNTAKANTVGRTHSLSVTAIDGFAVPYSASSTLSPPRSTQPHIKNKKSDMFGGIMQWDRIGSVSGSSRMRNNSNASSMFGGSSMFGSSSQFGSVSSSSSSLSVGEFGQITSPDRRTSGGGSMSRSTISRPFGSDVVFEPRWQAPRPKAGRSPKLSEPSIPPLPPTRSEERRRKSQSWSVEHETSTHSDVALDGLGYASDGNLDFGEDEDGGREGLELWSAYFNFTGPSKRAPAPDKAEEQHEGESDFEKYLRAPQGPARKVREMQSFESGLTARQVAGPSRGVNGSEEWSPVSEGDEDEDETRVLRRAPSAIRMKVEAEPVAADTEEKGRSERLHDIEPASYPLPDSPPMLSVNVPDSSSLLPDIAPSLLSSHEPDEFAHTPQPSQTRHQTPPPESSHLPTQPLPATSLLTRFPADVFDVLQTYRGLPLLDKLQDIKGKRRRRRGKGKKPVGGSSREGSDEVDLDPAEDGYERDSSSSESEDDGWSDRLTMMETIRLSLEDDESAAPRNDPRFVIWGDVIKPSSNAMDGESSIGVDVGSTSARSSIDLGSEGSGKRSRGTSLSRMKARSFAKGTKKEKEKEKEARSRSGSGTASATSPGIPAPPDVTLPPSAHEASSSTTALTASAVGGSGREQRRQLLGATIERWIAQVTSELDYDELLVFFMTYRTYISPVDLAHLLIARFHWALTAPSAATSTAQPSITNSAHTQAQDIERAERIKRFVRLRTFVAWKFWLNTFFYIDFWPNPELRKLVADWLNTLVRDPILGRWDDAMNIVKKLRKVAKECKRLHSPAPAKAKPKSSTATSHHRSSQSHTPTAHAPGAGPDDVVAGKETHTGKEHLFGEKFTQVTRQLSQAKKEEDSDVDLDLPDYDESVSKVGTGLPLSSLSILQRTDHAPGPDSPTLARGGGGAGTIGWGSYRGEFIESPATLPIHSNALSKVLVKTIGRLGRWKRVLNNRRPSTIGSKAIAGAGGVGAMGGSMGLGGAYIPSNAFGIGFEVTLNKERELLEVNGGLQEYLRVIEGQQQSRVNMSGNTGGDQQPAPNFTGRTASMAPSVSTVRTSKAPDRTSVAPSVVRESISQQQLVEDANTTSGSESVGAESRSETASRDDFSERSSIARSSSTDSFGVPLSATRSSAMFPAFTAPYNFDVVSIDELSDSSSDNEAEPPVPPGLRRLPRKLPTRAVMEVDDRGTVSSMGIVSRDSYASTRSSISELSGGEEHGLGRNIHPWQLNYLVDSLTDDEDAGDVEDALKRLEGQINPEKTLQKASKVEGWVRTIRAKMATGDYDEDERPRWQDSESDESDDQDYDIHANPNLGESSTSVQTNAIPVITRPESGEIGAAEPIDIPVVATSHTITSPPRPTSEAKPAPEDAVPLEILQSRLSSEIPSVQPTRPSFAPKAKSDVYRSFILGYKAEELAQQFAIIDRELILTASFDELLTGDWMNCEEIDVLDWNQFQKDRARWKAESRWPERTGALGNIRGRFNLVANFTVSEIVRSHPSERSSVFSKLLHIAWRSYERNCFATVVAIITGLQSKYVTMVMRRLIGRVTSYDQRRFRDLKLFIANDNNFMHLNEAVNRIMDIQSADAQSGIASANMDPSGRNKNETTSSPACIPFIGTYLSQLYQHHQLPDLIDPTAPDEIVNIDPLTSNLDSPAHPEIFDALAPLPPSMHLEPLVNVHKQRLIAGVVQSFIAAQHLASRIQFSRDKRLHKQCLELKALDSDTLQSMLNSFSG
ncbi:Guanine nucleotide exchange factor lte1 [Paramarasmius palmivorus]|uniref:Guanine nucleotide exchange factor lte1 n=1 Tax=Paramarasmius palmivorus TaxID=297713 RepID=A0AAW0D650_9AGAR